MSTSSSSTPPAAAAVAGAPTSQAPSSPSPRPSSPSALTRFLGCEYRTYLDVLEARDEPVGKRNPPNMELLLERGNRYEEQIIERWRAEGRSVLTIERADRATRQRRVDETLAAMRAGQEIIHQGCFVHEGWVGYPDFLIRVDGEPSDLGEWSYEVADAKLGSKPRPEYIFQLLFYDDHLTRLQGRRPTRMRLLLGDGTDPAFTAADFNAYAARIHQLFAERCAQLEAPTPEPAPGYPYPVAGCDFCHWWVHCKDRRREDDHLSLVANLSRDQGLKLEAHGIHTLAQLAALPGDAIVPRLAADTVTRLRDQADLQLRSRGRAKPIHKLLKPAVDTGLARLPRPSEGDVHFDFEGDPYWGEPHTEPDGTLSEFDGESWGDDGLDYLFGTLYDEPGGTTTYWPLWATNRAEERAAFEQWIDWIHARLEQHKDLHVYHYNSYEVVALKRLATRHATRIDELDDLLRKEVFVDLYGITRQAIRAGVESYGLKGMEPVYAFERNAELKGAIGSLKRWQSYLQDRDTAHLRAIELYNRDDCLSTHALYAWLRARMPDAEAEHGTTIDALEPDPERPPGERAAELKARRDTLRGPLTDGLPEDHDEDDHEQRARRNAFALLDYHERDRKPAWWEFFDRRERSASQLRHEDGDAIGELTVISGPETAKKSWQWELAYPEQAHKLGPGRVDSPDIKGGGTIVEIDDAKRTVIYTHAKTEPQSKTHPKTPEELAAGTQARLLPPTRLAPKGPLDTKAQEDALYAFAKRIVGRGTEPCGELDAGTDLLMRRAPRLRPGTPPLADEPFDLHRLRAQVRGLQDSALVIQGPPGAGKTWTGARIAIDLIARGKTVGVMATSHKAINNLLCAILDAADEANAQAGDRDVVDARGWERVDVRGWKKITEPDDGCDRAPRIIDKKVHPGDDPDTGRRVNLIGGTAWHWAGVGAPADGDADSVAPEDDPSSVDILLIDEAGQVSLADAIAVSQGARSVVLLGDPQQLAHVSQGTHAHGSGASVLEHLLAGEPTVPRDRGVFLATSWRMHPEICDFISRAMYGGDLKPVEGSEVQRVDSPGGLGGSGLRLLSCEHDDNRGRSQEEADLIAREVERLLDGGTVQLRGDAAPRTLRPDDILVVAPYNAQVRCLQQVLRSGVRAGTVDKFQGQEAPVVFFSMTASSGEDVSRGLSFLFSRNRLNVAVSRAQALAVVVCSPRLLHARCSNVDDMRLVNMLCQFADAAAATEVAPL